MRTTTILLALALALPAFAADDACTWTQVGRDGPKTCTTTSQFDNLTEGAPSERSISIPAGAVRLAQVELRSENCTSCSLTIQTASGLNAGQILFNAIASEILSRTPEPGGATYEDYLNETVGSSGVLPRVDGESVAFARVYNGDSEGPADEDVTVFCVWSDQP